MEKNNNKIQLNTVKFGDIEVDKEFIFSFVLPIIGFEHLKDYTIIDIKPDSPFKWLQSTEDMELAFPITLCSYFGIDYQFDIPDEEAEKINIENTDDVFVFNIVNIPNSNPQGATVNMVAPIVVNLANKKAMQIILKNTDFEVRHKLYGKTDMEE